MKDKDTKQFIKLNESQVQKVNNELQVEIDKNIYKFSELDINLMKSIVKCEEKQQDTTYQNILQNCVDKTFYDYDKYKNEGQEFISARLKMCGRLSSKKWQDTCAINKEKEKSKTLTNYNSNENTLLCIKVWNS